MKRLLIYTLLCISTLIVLAQGDNLRYEKNLGQWNTDIVFSSAFRQGKIYLQKDHISILILDSNNRYFHPHNSTNNTNKKEKYSVFSIFPYKANFKIIEPQEQLSGYTNYFIGKDKKKWQHNVPSFGSVIYKNIYPNIDWEIASSSKLPKHSYIVHPNGLVNQIATLYKGVKNITIKNNKLIIETINDQIEENALFVYQKNGEEIKIINADYVLTKQDDNFLVSYNIGNYDKTQDLIIDPELVFSTYSGSHSDNWGMTSCYDKSGLMISGGICIADEYPTTEGAYEEEYSGNWDCVFTKYDSLGQNMIFSTYLGGSRGEMPHSMIVNNNNEIVIFGTTGSNDFPISSNAFQSSFAGGDSVLYESSISYSHGSDIFVSTLNSSGSELLYSTYIGGTSNDGINFKPYYGSIQTLYNGNDSLYANYGDIARGEIITDKNNNVYVSSTTFSSDFPTSQTAYKKTLSGNQDAIVFKFDRSLSTLIYSTYYGGTSADAAYSLDLDTLNRIYFCGGTICTKPTFSTKTDAFVALLSQDGSAIEADTIYGSNEYDQAYFVRLDKQGFPYIYGQTKAQGSTLIHNAQYNIPNSGQFIAKFSPSLDSLCFSTVFGSGDGIINLSPSGFAVDYCERIYCAGWGRRFKYMQDQFGYTTLGTSGLEVTDNAYMDTTDGMDFYIMCLNTNASSLQYATFFGEYSNSFFYGNDHVDGGTSRFDKYGNFYLSICASCRGSNGMPTTEGAVSSTNNSTNCNMASVKFSINDDFAVADFKTPPIVCKNSSVQFENYSRGDSYQWNFGDNSPISTQKNPTHSYSNSGLYTITLISHLNEGCKQADTIQSNILVLGSSHYYLDTLTTCIEQPINIGFDNLPLDENSDISFSWYPSELVSDANSINPYANITESTLFTLIITMSDCNDTIYRYVDLVKLPNEFEDTLTYCSTPTYYYIPNPQHRILKCSLNKDFTDTLSFVANTDSLIIDTRTSSYLYIRYTEGDCTALDSIYLNYTGLKFDFNIVDAGCHGMNTGKAEVILLDNTENVHYSWSCTLNDTSAVEQLAPGSYSVRITNNDNNDCYNIIDFTIYSLVQMSTTFETKNATCNSVCDGMITANVSGGEAPYTLLWSNGLTSSSIANLCPMDYTLIIIDANNCVDTQKVSIMSSYNVNLSLSATENNCDEGCSAIITSNVVNAQQPIYYFWNDGSTSNNLIDACNGEYSLIVTDSAGCKDTASINVTSVDRFADFVALVDKNHVYDGQNVHLSSTYYDNVYYNWTPSTYLQDPNNYETDATVYETTTYVVYVTDQKGCSKSDSVIVEVEYVNCDKPNIFVPNAFTPNGDGKNDVLFVSGEYISSMNFMIYDRWGERVFQSDNITEGWDGKFRDSNCPAGVYYYRLEITCDGGKTFFTKGDITLIR